MDFVRENPGGPVAEGIFCYLMDFLVQYDDNTGRRTNNPDGLTQSRLIGAPTSAIPPLLRQMPFLAQPSQFILAWDSHQIC